MRVLTVVDGLIKVSAMEDGPSETVLDRDGSPDNATVAEGREEALSLADGADVCCDELSSCRRTAV